MRYTYTSRRWPLFVLALLFMLAGCSKTGGHPISGSGGASSGGGASSSSGSGGQGTGGGVVSNPGAPMITSFIANPASLPQGGGMSTLSWTVSGATSLSLDQGIGTVTGSSHSVTLMATTTYTLTATNAMGKSTATAIVTVGTAAGVNPPSGARYAAMIAPVDGETFVGSTVDLRFVGVGRDSNNFMGNGPGGGLNQAASVDFFVDGTSVLTVDAANSEYWVFKGYVKGLSLSPGDHTIFARASYTANPGPVGHSDSVPVTINVQAAPTYGKTIDMSGDLTLADVASLVGTAASRVRVNGNGHRIHDPGSAAAVDWQFVDFYDLGDPTNTSALGIDVTTTGKVTIQSCRFDSSNTVGFSIGGTATADIRGNLFRSNMRQPLGQLPYMSSFPTIQITGGSTGAKTFAGNNLGAGWVDFQAVSSWTVGGDTDADSNVLVGPRVGIFFDYMGNATSSNIVVKRNYSDHIYYGGWSQGNNLEAGGNTSLLAENNVLVSSSWTVRGMAGEFRYNLLLLAGEDWMWLDTGANVHHNVFVGGDNNRGDVYNTYSNTNIRIQNNTFDGLGGTGVGINAIFVTGSETVSSNLFMNLPYTSVDLMSGMLQADYNLFWKCSSPPYSDSRVPAHDVHADPLLASPPAFQFEFDEKAVWQRTQSVHDILSAYRAKYAPKAGSPAIDSGDPTIFGAGNDIGAIGNGATNAADLFGK
jgi:hypothetical protein